LVDRLADLFAEEDKEGIEGTDLRAGLIKIGADYMRILPVEEKRIRATAAAHLSTGASIVAHTTLDTMALEILDLLEKEDMDPASVIFYHVDRNLDPWYWEQILERGLHNIRQDREDKVRARKSESRVPSINGFAGDTRTKCSLARIPPVGWISCRMMEGRA